MDTPVQGQRTKPMVDGMYTRHVDYKYGKNKLSPEAKRRVQTEQSRRCASKRQALQNGRGILSGRR